MLVVSGHACQQVTGEVHPVVLAGNAAQGPVGVGVEAAMVTRQASEEDLPELAVFAVAFQDLAAALRG